MPNEIGKKKLKNTTKAPSNLKAAYFAGDVKRNTVGVPSSMTSDELLAFIMRDKTVAAAIAKENPELWATIERMFPAVANTQRKKGEIVAAGGADINLTDMGLDRLEQHGKLRDVRGNYIQTGSNNFAVPQHESEVSAGDVAGLLKAAVASAKTRR